MIKFVNRKRERLLLKEKFDFFATGISYMLTGLCLDEMRPWIGAKLAASSQDLYYSYQMAKYFLNRRQADKIKFCLIGITPYSFPYRMSLSENWGRELYYLPFLSMQLFLLQIFIEIFVLIFDICLCIFVLFFL